MPMPCCAAWSGALTATWRTWNWVMAGTTVVFAWLTYGWPNYAMRVVFFTVVMGVLHAAQLRFMLRHGGRNFPVRLVEVVLALHMLVLAVRLGSILAGNAGSGLMEASVFQTLYVGAYVLTVLMLSIIQGLYILREDEGEELEKRRNKKKRNQQKNDPGAKKKRRPDEETERRKKSGSRNDGQGTRQKYREQPDEFERRIEEQTENSLHW